MFCSSTSEREITGKTAMMLHMMKKLAVSAGGVKVASLAGSLSNMVLPHVPTEVKWQPSNT